MQSFYEAKQADLEAALLEALTPDEPWSLLERFTSLVRESSSADEREAFDYIAGRLEALGIPHEMHMPELFLSVPVRASLAVGSQSYRAKTPAFSISTPPAGVSGEMARIEGFAAGRSADFFDFTPVTEVDVRGKIVVVDGFGGPPPVWYFQNQGAIGAIFINPGVDIHWGICTTIWGAPDLDNYQRQPNIPVLSINRPDGEDLMQRMADGQTQATLHTQLKEGWFECPCLVAEIKGAIEPERFVLVHGHVDSWDVGIGDNAVGNATLLELARIFHSQADNLARTLRVAWWSGHSTGRYGASTWYADKFGLDLARDCVAQMNIDSPGCRWATEYRGVTIMSEAHDFAKQTVLDATGLGFTGERPHQAGDYSFNNIGISSLFMLLSSMPLSKAEEMGYYAVGGCGANIAWHTENDTLEIADKDHLMRDLRVYAASLQRLLNNPLHPYDFRALTAEFAATLADYAAAAGDDVDFSPATSALADLNGALDELYAAAGGLADGAVADAGVRAFNDALLAMARELVLINFTRQGRFRTEPAMRVPQLPDLAPALELANADAHMRRVTRTHLVRGVNRVAWAFETAANIARAALEKINT
ncbi:MAG: M28 family peptidase [Chloroflexi bacterium]|nr:M28 family peptidase [Chloroflexota bacterium]MCY3582526.1 M28 family peptidase [Chloroflexota bacterium]MCY3717428.1 M28 family peptidase [Chloroflexota bacterium]MDE2650347.1 M28 family peptidase [Chloroflexota bacterium]MYA92365.1 M28 family peptidase [Chloroflexota bacterium]